MGNCLVPLKLALGAPSGATSPSKWTLCDWVVPAACHVTDSPGITATRDGLKVRVVDRHRPVGRQRRQHPDAEAAGEDREGDGAPHAAPYAAAG